MVKRYNVIVLVDYMGKEISPGIVYCRDRNYCLVLDARLTKWERQQIAAREMAYIAENLPQKSYLIGVDKIEGKRLLRRAK